MCSKYFERKQSDAYTIYQDNIGKVFCSKICFNIYIIMNRKIVACSWCKVKKYNFDMIHKLYNDVSMCSLNCLTLCEVSMNAIAMKRIKCDHCKTLKQPQYHLTMSDASIRNFCTYQCVMSFQSQFNKQPLTLDAETAAASASGALHPVPTGLPKRVKKCEYSLVGLKLNFRPYLENKITLLVFLTFFSTFPSQMNPLIWKNLDENVKNMSKAKNKLTFYTNLG
jgi:zinc finger MYM-type protein 2/3/4